MTCLLQSKNDPDYSMKRKNINKTIYALNEKNNLCVTFPKVNCKKEEIPHKEINDNHKEMKEYDNYNKCDKQSYTQDRFKDCGDSAYYPFELFKETQRDKLKQLKIINSDSATKVLFKSSFPLFFNTGIMKTQKLRLDTYNINRINRTKTFFRSFTTNNSTIPNQTRLYYKNEELLKNKQNNLRRQLKRCLINNTIPERKTKEN